MARVSKANAIRTRLRFLYEMGDAAVPNEAWRDTDEHIINQYSWTLDSTIIVDPWPPGAEWSAEEEITEELIQLIGPGGTMWTHQPGEDCPHCGMPYFHDDQLRCACCSERRTKQ